MCFGHPDISLDCSNFYIKNILDCVVFGFTQFWYVHTRRDTRVRACTHTHFDYHNLVKTIAN